jgi:hypothetical protein
VILGSKPAWGTDGCVVCVLQEIQKSKARKTQKNKKNKDKIQNEKENKKFPVEALFTAHVHTGQGTHADSYAMGKWVPDLFPMGKTAGEWR